MWNFFHLLRTWWCRGSARRTPCRLDHGRIVGVRYAFVQISLAFRRPSRSTLQLAAYSAVSACRPRSLLVVELHPLADHPLHALEAAPRVVTLVQVHRLVLQPDARHTLVRSLFWSTGTMPRSSRRTNTARITPRPCAGRPAYPSACEVVVQHAAALNGEMPLVNWLP